jgi:predicted pyridoxine 5'-phosphate oxidase superfamily flavin-nucleotide-binding protein
MNMNKQTEAFLLSAESKALATYGESLNVVPLSSIKIVDGKIWLINYFMDKTISNILKNPSVSLVCWTDMIGFQIKGTVEYKTDGEDFDHAAAWIHDILPDRVVKGLLVLIPQDIYDIAPTKNTMETISQK